MKTCDSSASFCNPFTCSFPLPSPDAAEVHAEVGVGGKGSLGGLLQSQRCNLKFCSGGCPQLPLAAKRESVCYLFLLAGFIPRSSWLVVEWGLCLGAGEWFESP